MEPIVITDYNEWNEIIDQCESLRIKYKIKQRLSNLHLSLINNKGFQFARYVFSVSGEEPEYEPSIISIAKEFNKVPYNHIEGQYGYREVPTEDPHRFKVKWDIENSRPFGFFEEYFANQEKVIKERSILYKVANTGDGSNSLTDIFGKKDSFENPKPVELLKVFIRGASTGDDIVLDFFSCEQFVFYQHYFAKLPVCEIVFYFVIYHNFINLVNNYRTLQANQRPGSIRTRLHGDFPF